MVDASTWVDYLIGRLEGAHRATLLRGDAISPPHVDFEVGSALLRLERRDQLPGGLAEALMVEFIAMPFPREACGDDIVMAFSLIDNATLADAIYLAMAKRVEAAVMSSDSGLIRCAGAADVEAINTTPS